MAGGGIFLSFTDSEWERWCRTMVTGIGNVVNGLREHVCSKQIRNLSRKLIGCWKKAVNECVSSTNTIAGDSQNSVQPACVEEEGLPLPPMDGEVLLEIQTTRMELTSIELSQFFDGLDDDGNPQGDYNIEEKNCEHGTKSTTENQKRKPEAIDNQTTTSVIYVWARNTGQEKPQEKFPVSESLKLKVTKRKLQEAYQAGCFC